MPLSVMRSVKSELLTSWKGQPACWEYLLRMFLTSKISALLLLSSYSGLSEFMTWTGFFFLVGGSTVAQSLATHLSRSTTRITHANSTNSGNAKMLMPTFTRGCEVGLFKQRGVCKVRKGITHSQSASEVHTSVNQQKYTIILDSSVKSVKQTEALNIKSKKLIEINFQHLLKSTKPKETLQTMGLFFITT